MLSSKVVERARIAHFGLVLVCLSILMAISIRPENNIDAARKEAIDLSKLIYFGIDQVDYIKATLTKTLVKDQHQITQVKVLVKKIKNRLKLSSDGFKYNYSDYFASAQLEQDGTYENFENAILKLRTTRFTQLPVYWDRLILNKQYLWMPNHIIEGEGDSVSLDAGMTHQVYPTLDDVLESTKYGIAQTSNFQKMQYQCSQSPSLDEEISNPRCILKIYFYRQELPLSNKGKGSEENAKDIFSVGIRVRSKGIHFSYLEIAKIQLKIDHNGQTFEQLFPNLLKVIEGSKNKGIGNLTLIKESNGKTQAENYFTDFLEITNSDNFELFGLKAPTRLLLLWGSPIITLVLGYLYAHMLKLASLLHHVQRSIDEAWIVLYDGLFAKILVVLSFFVLPVVTLVLLTSISYEIGQINFGITISSTIIALVLLSGIAITIKSLWRRGVCKHRVRYA